MGFLDIFDFDKNKNALDFAARMAMFDAIMGDDEEDEDDEDELLELVDLDDDELEDDFDDFDDLW